jgi:hypothetical protein
MPRGNLECPIQLCAAYLQRAARTRGALQVVGARAAGERAAYRRRTLFGRRASRRRARRVPSTYSIRSAREPQASAPRTVDVLYSVGARAEGERATIPRRATADPTTNPRRTHDDPTVAGEHQIYRRNTLRRKKRGQPLLQR